MSEKHEATLLERELAATVRPGLFRNEAETVHEVLDTFFTAKPHYRIEAALAMWKADEVSLARAAEIAGMNFFLFRDLMIQRGLTVERDTAEADARAQSQEIHDRFM